MVLIHREESDNQLRPLCSLRDTSGCLPVSGGLFNSMQTKWLHTERLSMRPYSAQDLPAVIEFLGDSETMGFYPKPFSEGKISAMIRRSEQSWVSSGFGQFVVIEKASNSIVGDCGITLQEIDGERLPELGYRFKRSVWGQGFAAEAATAVARFGFEKARLSALRSYMPASHTQSRRVAEKIGMRLEKEFNNRNNRDVATVVYVLSAKKKASA